MYAWLPVSLLGTELVADPNGGWGGVFSVEQEEPGAGPEHPLNSRVGLRGACGAMHLAHAYPQAQGVQD